MNPDAAGLDVGATFHVVAVAPERDEQPVRTFGTFSSDLIDWPTGCRRSASPRSRWNRPECTGFRSSRSFASWLSLAPGNKVSGGRLLSSKTRRSANRAAVLLRIAAVDIGRTQTALGAFYRRLVARIGKAKAVTATARKFAVLFYNALRFGMAYADPGASYYEARYRQRVLDNLRRRAHQMGFTLVASPVSNG
jgi:hypothetical protein